MKNVIFEIKKRIVWLICRPTVGRLAGLIFGDRLRHHGAAIYTDSESVAPGVKARLLWGLYEHAETDFVREYLPTDLDVIELGSSLGVVSTHIARRIDDDRSLICVEANPALVGEIDRNVRGNVPNQEFEVVNAAIDYRGSATVPFTVERVHVDSRVGGDQRAENTIDVPVVTLSSLIADYEVDRYALVMDIEGAEQSLLGQDSDALKSCDFIIAELHELVGQGVGCEINNMVNHIEGQLGFELVCSRGDVYAFSR